MPDDNKEVTKNDTEVGLVTEALGSVGDEVSVEVIKFGPGEVPDGIDLKTWRCVQEPETDSTHGSSSE